MTSQARRNVVRWGVSLSGGLLVASVAFVVLLLVAALARAAEGTAAATEPAVAAVAAQPLEEGPDAPPVIEPELSSWQRSIEAAFAWANTPAGRMTVVFFAIVLFVDGLRKSFPQLRRRKDGSIPWWGSVVIWGVLTTLGQLAAYGGLLSPFTGAGKIGETFAGILVSGMAVATNEVVMSLLRKGLQLVLTRFLGKDAPQVELTPGPDDVPPGSLPPAP